MPEPMKRGRTERETCDLNGWGVGTTLRGHEQWGSGQMGTWTTIRLTALGESTILARCIRHESTREGEVIEDRKCQDGEHMWTLDHREWSEVPA